MSPVFLLLGSNLGDRLTNLLEARQQISRKAGKIITASSIYKTKAWGGKDQPDFYNQTLRISPVHSSYETLAHLLEIEKEMGRVREEKWGNRLIDIDILLWGNERIQSANLTVPHPYLHLRRFTLVPLAEIAPQFIHPVFNKTIQELLEECTDPLAVSKLE